jgi:hypothetical protein
MKTVQVNNEDLPRVRDAVEGLPNIEARRFVVDGHDGKKYWHNEYDEVAIPGVSQMEDLDITSYLKEACLKEGYQIYCIIEVKGDVDINKLETLSVNEVAGLIRLVYYDFSDEPLESFRSEL